MSLGKNSEPNKQLIGGDSISHDESFFIIVVPSYNNKDHYQMNLESILNQEYSFYHVIYINDHSTDGTGELVQEYIEKNGKEDKVTLINNKSRIGATGNIYKVVHQCHPHSIIVTVDGDDWFAHNHVLSHINTHYRDPNVWLTYGQYLRYPNNVVGHCREVPQEVIKKNDFRKYFWITSHLRTFYAGLYQKIEKQDLLYDGKYFVMAYDLAMMFPMLEMAGEHIKFIPDILYVYNLETPFNNHKLNRQFQIQMDKEIRKRSKYEPIKSLF